MIAHWMLYCLAVGLLLSLAALATERAMRAFRLPQRWVWAAAMVMMIAIPAVARWMPRPALSVAAAPAAGGEGTRVRLADFAGQAVAQAAPRIDVAALDRPLVMGWMMLSLAALLALVLAWAVLERRRRGWPAAEVDGVPVLLSPATGPAVIGLFRSRIVLPRWVVADASDDVRVLLLDHELEHLRAGDPRLLALGLAGVAAMPWNPAAWWMLRRLRLAMEVDCDARVLARRADVRAYGTLLLEVGRRGTGGRLLAAAFSEPASFLERRIRIMTSPRVRRPWLRAAGFGAAALAMIVAACEAPGPVQSSPTPSAVEMQPVRTESSTARVAIPSAARISRADIEAAVRQHYPQVFSGAPGDSTALLFVIDEHGKVERHERLQMKAVEFDDVTGQPQRVRWSELSRGPDARASMMDAITFQPGQMGPGRVEILWVRKLAADQLVTTTDTRRERLRQPDPSQPRVPQNPAAQITREQAREHVARWFPQVARGESTPESVWIVVGADGRVVAYGDERNTEQLNRPEHEIDNVQVFKGENLVFNGHQVGLIYVTLKG